jgi:hypothetical protein
MSALYWLASFLNLDKVLLWFQKISAKLKKLLFTEQILASAGSIGTIQKLSLTDHQFKHVTRFDNLPDELFLAICRYLSLAHVLNAFLDCNNRTFRCISDYRTNMNLAKWSYTDLQSILDPIDSKRLMISDQIQYLSSEKSSLKLSCFEHVHRLSMLDCTQYDIFSLYQILPNFPRLQSLRIVDCASNDYKSNVNLLRDWLCDLIFDSALDAPLTTIQLMINIGIILSKQIVPNKRLTHLSLSPKTIDDLVLNLIVLNVTLCDARVSSRSLLPPRWPHYSMSHLTEFRLTTKENVKWKLEYLHGIVMPLGQLHTLSLDVENWTSDDNQFPQGNQIQTIIDQYLPHLRYFYCNIQAKRHVNMEVTFIFQLYFSSNFFSFKTFVGLNRRWLIAYRIDPHTRVDTCTQFRGHSEC